MGTPRPCSREALLLKPGGLRAEGRLQRAPLSVAIRRANSRATPGTPRAHLAKNANSQKDAKNGPQAYPKTLTFPPGLAGGARTQTSKTQPVKQVQSFLQKTDTSREILVEPIRPKTHPAPLTLRGRTPWPPARRQTLSSLTPFANGTTKGLLLIRARR